MAEVVGVVASVAGLISLTIEVFEISHEYINGVRGASSSIVSFLQELEDLKSVLIKIDHLAKDLANDAEVFGGDGSSTRFLSHEESSRYLNLLQTIRSDLKKRLPDGSFRKRVKNLTWPFSEDKTLTLVEALHRHLDIYRTALAIDNLVIGKLTLSEVRQAKISQQGSEKQVILDWLSPLRMYQKQQDVLSRRHGTTGSWLLNHATFQRWINSEGSDRTLWCPGDPGTGKTVMTSIVVDYLTSLYAAEDIRIAYVYCDYKDQEMQTALNIIACLSRQLIERSQRIPLQLERMYKELEQQRRRPQIEELRRLLVTLCNERERTYILVDALDECEATTQRRYILPLLQSLPHGSTRLFVTSRPNNEDIFHIFRSAPQVHIAAPESEINRFVAEKMEERKEFLERLTVPGLKEEIISTICAGASGMFLLAVLQINRICVARTVKLIKAALNSMPRELDQVYEQTLQRIRKQAGDDGQLGMRVLSWITYARRPLSVDELRHGLAVEYDEEDLRAEFDPDNLLSPGSLVDVCAGLVVIDSKSHIIRLVHYTTQEFFDKQRRSIFENPEADIARACLTYLSYNAAQHFPSDGSMTDWYIIKVLNSYPFMGYASRFWVSHVNACAVHQEGNLILEEALEYARDSHRRLLAAIILRKQHLRPSSYGRLKDHQLLANPALLHLEAAAECGLQDILEFFLKNGIYSDSALNGALNCAASEGHAKQVAFLIEQGADASSFASDSSNSLHKACKRGHLEIVKVLLANGAQPDVKDRWQWTPLHYASRHHHSEVVRFLLKKNADPNVQTPLGMSPCHFAASNGDVETVASLADSGCNLAAQTRGLDTPLHYAASEGHIAALRLLLQRGAPIFRENKEGITAWDKARSWTDNAWQRELEAEFTPYVEASLRSSTQVKGKPENGPSQTEHTEEAHASSTDGSADEDLFESINTTEEYRSADESLQTIRGPGSLKFRDNGEDIACYPESPAVPLLQLIQPTPPTSDTESLHENGEE